MKSRSPLVAEEKGAIGCLLLLALQQVHEVVLFYFVRDSRLPHLHLLSPFLLALFLSLALGLYRQNRRAWWVAVLSLAALGPLHLVAFWTPVKNSMEPPPPRFVNALEYEWLMPFRLSPFDVFWVIARGVMLLLVPTLLLLGRLRKALQPA